MKTMHVLDRLVAVNLDVRIWSGRKKLTAEDLSLGADVPPEDLVSLGSKRVCDPDADQGVPPPQEAGGARLPHRRHALPGRLRHPGEAHRDGGGGAGRPRRGIRPGARHLRRRLRRGHRGLDRPAPPVGGSDPQGGGPRLPGGVPSRLRLPALPDRTGGQRRQPG